MATPFSYEFRNTPVHRLNPVSKLVLFFSFTLLGGLYLDPRLSAPMLLLLCVILRLARLRITAYRGILILAVLAALVNRAYTAFILVDPAMFQIYSQEWVSTVIMELTGPDFPLLGRTAVTYGSLLYLLSSPLQVTLVVLSVAGLLHTTSLGDIVSILAKLKAPFPVTFMATVSLRFVPHIVEEIRMVQRAQSLRGWTMDTPNPVKKLLRLRPLLVPVLRSAIRTVDAISMSSKNRAFGIGAVTPLADFGFRAADRAVCTIVSAITLTALYATLAWNLGSL